MVAAGSNVQSNNWFIDGIETTAPETGTSWIWVNPDSIQEVQVMGIGAPAEYGNMLGAAMNMVTKSGSNQFQGGVNIYWFDDSLVNSEINSDSEYPEFVQKEFWDVTATLGGPIVKDRLWFFVAYEYWRDNHAFPGSDPETNPTRIRIATISNYRARINDANLIDGKGLHVDDWGYPASSSSYYEQSAIAGEIGNDVTWGINYQAIFSDRTFLEARYTGWYSNDDNLSQTGSMEPAYIDYSPPGGGPALILAVCGGLSDLRHLRRPGERLARRPFADDFIAGDHDFKFGIQASRGESVTQLQARIWRQLLCSLHLRLRRHHLRLLLQGRRDRPTTTATRTGFDFGLRRRLVDGHRPADAQPRAALRPPQVGIIPVLHRSRSQRPTRPVRSSRASTRSSPGTTSRRASASPTAARRRPNRP